MEPGRMPMVYGETYGGQCPDCGRGMLMKHDAPYAAPAMAYDACPWCGYAYGEGWVRDRTEGVRYGVMPISDLWKAILLRHQVPNREALLRAHPNWTEHCVPDGFGPWPRTYMITDSARATGDQAFSREWLAENPAPEPPKRHQRPSRKGAATHGHRLMDDQPLPAAPITSYGLPEQVLRAMLDRRGAGD